MASNDGKALARRYLDDVLNKRDFTAVDSLLSENATDNIMGSMASFLTFAAFPDFHISAEQIVAEGELVTVLATYTGTHRRTFMGIAPTDTGVTGRVAFAFRVTDDAITETWAEIEPWGLLQQLGALDDGEGFEQSS